MIAEESAIFHLLRGDPTVVNLVGTFRNQPAIFVEEVPPEFPVELEAYLVIGTVADPPWDTHDTPGNQTLIDIRCYTPRTGNFLGQNGQLTEAVKRATNRSKPPVNGRSLVNLAVIGITVLPPDLHLVGRVVTAQMITQEAT